MSWGSEGLFPDVVTVFWGVGWNSEGIYTRRSILNEIEIWDPAPSGVPEVLFEVLRRFPEAHSAVVRALEEIVDASGRKRWNPGSG